MKPQADFSFQEMQEEILDRAIHSSRFTSTALPQVLMKYHSLVNGSTDFEEGLSLPNFPFITLTFNHVAYAGRLFSLDVHHSKFSNLLSHFMPFLWFTCGLFLGFGMKARATKRCIL